MLKYIGGGSYILGVPARDLTDDEEKEHARLIHAEEKASGLVLYEKVEKTVAKPAKDAPAGAKE